MSKSLGAVKSKVDLQSPGERHRPKLGAHQEFRPPHQTNSFSKNHLTFCMHEVSRLVALGCAVSKKPEHAENIETSTLHETAFYLKPLLHEEPLIDMQLLHICAVQ